MDIERREIERRDFQQARRGYDPAQVDRHLQWIADAFEDLRNAQPPQATLAGAAASRVESIVAAAEASAREIEEKAQLEAQALTDQADREAGERVRRAQEVVEELLAQARDLQSQMSELAGSIGGLKGSVESMLTGVDQLRPSEPPRVLEAVPEPAARLEPDPAPVELSVVPEPEPEPAAAAAPEPEPEPEPEPAPAPAPPPARRRKPPGDAERASEGARLIALNMALSGSSREETARYLQENFDLEDQDEILDDVYARVGS
jgi:DivIVA domain-containing protein